MSCVNGPEKTFQNNVLTNTKLICVCSVVAGKGFVSCREKIALYYNVAVIRVLGLVKCFQVVHRFDLQLRSDY